MKETLAKTTPDASLRGVRVVVMSQFYDPEPVPIPGHVARGLADRGADVEVLTMQPKYPDGMPFAAEPRDGADGDHPRVRVRRIRAWRRHPRNGGGRVVSYLSFAAAAMMRRRILRAADVVYVYGTPMTAALPVWLAGSRMPPYLVHVQDLWPESVTGSSMVPGRLQGLVRSCLDPWLRSVYGRAAFVMAIAPTMRDRLASRSPAPGRVHTVLNWANESDGPAPRRSRSAPVGGLRLLYAGNVGWMQGLDGVIEAVRRVPPHVPVQLRVIGAGSALEEVARRAADQVAAGRVVFIPPVPASELEPHYAWADFSLVPLRGLHVFEATIPSKLQGSLYAGLPVITTVSGDVRSLVEKHGLGLVANADDPDSIAQAMVAAARVDPVGYSAWSHRVATYYRGNMSREVGLDRIAALVSAATSMTETDTQET